MSFTTTKIHEILLSGFRGVVLTNCFSSISHFGQILKFVKGEIPREKIESKFPVDMHIYTICPEILLSSFRAVALTRKTGLTNWLTDGRVKNIIPSPTRCMGYNEKVVISVYIYMYKRSWLLWDMHKIYHKYTGIWIINSSILVKHSGYMLWGKSWTSKIFIITSIFFYYLKNTSLCNLTKTQISLSFLLSLSLSLSLSRSLISSFLSKQTHTYQYTHIQTFTHKWHLI